VAKLARPATEDLEDGEVLPWLPQLLAQEELPLVVEAAAASPDGAGDLIGEIVEAELFPVSFRVAR